MFKVPSPSFVPLVKMVESKAFANLDALPSTLSIGVGVFGPATAYALVWELGSNKLKKPGPKTVWGVNRLGQKKILTKQAPKGYAGVNGKKCQKILYKALQDVKFDISDMQTSKVALEVAMDNAAQQIAGLIRQSAPVGEGTLRAGIQAIYTDEDSLLEMSDQSYTLFL